MPPKLMKYGYSIGQIQHQTLTKVRSQAFENGWKAMELNHEHYDI